VDNRAGLSLLRIPVLVQNPPGDKPGTLFLQMPLSLCSLNSGSNANCYYIGNDRAAVLVDAGLSCRETERRMQKLGLSMEKVKAIFISHEHADHITGLPSLSKKYRMPVYITPSTLANTSLPVDPELVHSFTAGEAVSIGEITVLPFAKSHDAADPHSFLVSGEGIQVGVFTDIGYVCKELIRYFRQCHVAFLESNYCEVMLEEGNYPVHLKRRISGRKGHLSNTQALELFVQHRPKQLQHLILTHLSKNNNEPALVERLFREKAGNVRITVASRYEASPVFTADRYEKLKRLGTKALPESKGQLSLF
jgi:phosphoribosyl 1,2-cyclic phosphodiesterase